jgi:hypothetical protein
MYILYRSATATDSLPKDTTPPADTPTRGRAAAGRRRLPCRVWCWTFHGAQRKTEIRTATQLRLNTAQAEVAGGRGNPPATALSSRVRRWLVWAPSEGSKRRPAADPADTRNPSTPAVLAARSYQASLARDPSLPEPCSITKGAGRLARGQLCRERLQRTPPRFDQLHRYLFPLMRAAP